MGNIVIGYKNLVNEECTFTPSTEDSDHDADNLGKSHPAEYWETTSAVRQTLGVTLPEPEPADLAAALYITAGGGHRNLFQYTRDLTDSVWTATGLTTPLAVIGGDRFSGGEAMVLWFVKEDTSSGTHRLDQTGVEKYEASTACHVGVEVYVSQSTPWQSTTRNIRLQVGKGGNFANADFNLSAGTVIGTATGGDYGGTVETEITSVTGNENALVFVKRVRMACLTGTADDDLDIRLQALSGSTASYAGSTSEGLIVSNPKAVWIDSLGTDQIDDEIYLNGDTRSAVWLHEDFVDAANTAPGNPSLNQYRHLTRNADSQDYRDQQGFVHAYAFNTTNAVASTGALSFAFHDSTNGATSLSVSGIYIGPSYQPTQNWVRIRKSLIGPRVWDIDLGFQTWDDAMQEAHAMGLRASRFQGARTLGGQVYRAESNPVLVILDPDETTYGQEQILYGEVTAVEMDRDRWFADRGDGTGGSRPHVSFTIEEYWP